jgi:hypothetical protein
VEQLGGGERVLELEKRRSVLFLTTVRRGGRRGADSEEGQQQQQQDGGGGAPASGHHIRRRRPGRGDGRRRRLRVWLVQATTDEEEKLTWGRRESPDAISGNSEGTPAICLLSLVSALLLGGFPLCFVSLVGVGPLLLLLLLPSLHFLRRLHRPLLPVLSKRYFFSFLSPFIFFNENHLGLGSLTILPLERWVLFALRF